MTFTFSSSQQAVLGLRAAYHAVPPLTKIEKSRLMASAAHQPGMRGKHNPQKRIQNDAPVVLTIAGSDSGGGAGIQADLKTFAACGVFGCSAVTALTAQNTYGVSGIHAIPIDFLQQQLDAVLDDLPVSVIKTGVLPNPEAVEEVAASAKRHSHIPIVVDPVLVATSGDSLASSEVGRAIAERLFPLATVITPNLIEAAALLDGSPIGSVDDMKEAAAKLQATGPAYVLIKGGHLEGSSELADVLYDGHTHSVLTGPRIETGNTHGTGCTTASAIAAYMARGLPMESAVKAAKVYVTEALRRSAHLSIGSGKQKPFNHIYTIDDWRGMPPIDLRVYGVTDPACNRKSNRTNAAVVAAAIQGGATIIQLREKDAEGSAICAEAQAVLDIARPLKVPVLINDRIDVALATGADGVHVGQDDIPAHMARLLLGSSKILGVSVKTVEQAKLAEAAGADYLGAGAMHSTPTKDSSTISHDMLAEICQAVRIPVVAIGGLRAENAARCIQAGCAGIAVVSAIFAAEDPTQAAKGIRSIVDTALSKQ